MLGDLCGEIGVLVRVEVGVEFFKRRLVAAVTADPALLVPDNPEDLEAQCPPVDTGSVSGTDAG